MPVARPVLTEINVKELLRYAGVKNEDGLDGSLLQSACREALLYASPVGSWEVYGYRSPVLMADKQFIPDSAALICHIAGARHVAVLAVTAGQALEDEINRLFAGGSYALAVLLDAAATAAVEQVADSICSFIAGQASAEGLLPGRRFSPGYADWPLAQQPDVLRLSGGDNIGITLSSAFMLSPRKSITALAPLFPRKVKMREGVYCDKCEKTDCQFRR